MEYQNIEITLGNAKCRLTLDDSVEKPPYSSMHAHTSYELFCAWKGAVEIETEEKKMYAEAGKAVLIAPATYHSSRSFGGVEKMNVYFSFGRGGKRTQGEDVYAGLMRAFSFEDCRLLGNGDEIARRLHAIHRIMEGEAFCKSERLQAELAAFVFALYDSLAASSEPVAATDLQRATSMQYRYEIDNLLAHNYANDMDLDFLARALYLSPKRVAVLIKDLYGKNFRCVKAEMKIQAAKQLLKESSLTVLEVAEIVGYKSMRGFLTAFTQMTGETPSAYRNRHR